jgi:3-methyladenine DNA glycosylase Tag
MHAFMQAMGLVNDHAEDCGAALAVGWESPKMPA